MMRSALIFSQLTLPVEMGLSGHRRELPSSFGSGMKPKPILVGITGLAGCLPRGRRGLTCRLATLPRGRDSIAFLTPLGPGVREDQGYRSCFPRVSPAALSTRRVKRPVCGISAALLPDDSQFSLGPALAGPRYRFTMPGAILSITHSWEERQFIVNVFFNFLMQNIMIEIFPPPCVSPGKPGCLRCASNGEKAKRTAIPKLHYAQLGIWKSPQPN
jgi:hypothetical protein